MAYVGTKSRYRLIYTPKSGGDHKVEFVSDSHAMLLPDAIARAQQLIREGAHEVEIVELVSVVSINVIPIDWRP